MNHYSLGNLEFYLKDYIFEHIDALCKEIKESYICEVIKNYACKSI